jgi:hypothetical protein
MDGTIVIFIKIPIKMILDKTLIVLGKQESGKRNSVNIIASEKVYYQIKELYLASSPDFFNKDKIKITNHFLTKITRLEIVFPSQSYHYISNGNRIFIPVPPKHAPHTFLFPLTPLHSTFIFFSLQPRVPPSSHSPLTFLFI